MGICPICNGFEEIQSTCTACGNHSLDEGRIMDFYDEYSAYMPIDVMKLENGVPTDYSNKQCPHLLKCPVCGHQEVILMKE